MRIIFLQGNNETGASSPVRTVLGSLGKNMDNYFEPVYSMFFFLLFPFSIFPPLLHTFSLQLSLPSSTLNPLLSPFFLSILVAFSSLSSPYFALHFPPLSSLLFRCLSFTTPSPRSLFFFILFSSLPCFLPPLFSRSPPASPLFPLLVPFTFYFLPFPPLTPSCPLLLPLFPL